jgi:hypothetical protein
MEIWSQKIPNLPILLTIGSQFMAPRGHHRKMKSSSVFGASTPVIKASSGKRVGAVWNQTRYSGSGNSQAVSKTQAEERVFYSCTSPCQSTSHFIMSSPIMAWRVARSQFGLWIQVFLLQFLSTKQSLGSRWVTITETTTMDYIKESFSLLVESQATGEVVQNGCNVEPESSK